MAISTVKQLSGSQSKDDNHIAISGASQMSHSDITASAKVSPLTVSSAVIPLLVPKNATEFVVWATTNLVRVSEDSAAAQYSTPPSSVPVSYPCAKQTNIYLVRDGASDATVHFFFKTL